MLAGYEELFGEPVPKREVHAPLEPGNHPEIDDTPLLDMEDVKKILADDWGDAMGCSIGLYRYYCCYCNHGQIQACPSSRPFEAFKT
eukprot:6927290-Ditylum_brightwellii.AAC.1